MNFPRCVPDPVRDYCEALPWSELSVDEQDCIRRLVERPEMEGVYKLVPEGHRAVELIDAAWSARIDFQRYQDDLENAKEIVNKIAEKASELADLLRRFPKGIDAPREFSSLCRLLEISDNPADPLWTIERSRVTAQQTGNGGAVVVWLRVNKFRVVGIPKRRRIWFAA